MRERWQKDQYLAIVNSHAVDYPAPANHTYLYAFGFLSMIMLIVQILTGIFLAMHYTPHVDLAFASVEHIMRDVNNGWLIRYAHANGASFFFLVVYTHIARGLYFGSYMAPREHLWASGIAIFLLMVLTAFLGYVLPWGQMSFWGATVITNLASAVPFVGDSIVQWLWGGFSVDNATLNRFFSFHYLFPFLILGLVLAHIALLHAAGSTNPLGNEANVDMIPFYPYTIAKDVLAMCAMFTLFAFFIYFFPNTLGHPDNYIPANPMVTPAHIVPEWYLLPFYAILRSIPDKLGGVIAMGGAIILLGVLPWLNTAEVRSSAFRPIYRKFFWLFVANFLILGWIGQNEVESPYIEVGQAATIFYFASLLVIIPALGKLESLLMTIDTSENA
jgi:quinol-cytochrome oxidoreductase complex cytochrome b subunit